MEKKKTQFIKWFNGNDLLTPAPSMSCSLNNCALKSCSPAKRWVMRGGDHQGKQLCTLHTTLNPNPIPPVLFHHLLV